MKKLFVIILVLTLSIGAFAQAPEKMSYQAVIRDASNNLIINTAVGIKISILQGSSTGTSVYEETHNVLTNINGLVSLEIGGGSVVSGTFSSINWGTDQYYVNVETDPTGGTNYTINSTTQLISVPYALHAKTADNGPIGPTGPAGPAGFLTNGSAAGNTPYWNGSSWVTNSSNIFNNGGFVGIGTSSPTRRLEIMSYSSTMAELLLNSGTLNASVGQMFRAYKSSGNLYSEGQIRVQNTNKMTFQTGFNPSTVLMTIELSNGNVGIGQTNPISNTINSKFQVKGGDVYIEDINSGVIMKSPDGQCWRLTIDNTGAIITTAITCP